MLVGSPFDLLPQVAILDIIFTAALQVTLFFFNNYIKKGISKELYLKLNSLYCKEGNALLYTHTYRLKLLIHTLKAQHLDIFTMENKTNHISSDL